MINMFATYRSCTMLQFVTAILIQRTSLFFVFSNDALLGLESHVPRQTYRCHTAHIPHQTVLFVTMYVIEAVVQRIVCTPSLEMTIVKVQCGGECQPSEQQVAGYNLHPGV